MDNGRTRKSCYARVNEDPKDVIIREYQEEITQLKNLLEQKRNALKKQTECSGKNSGSGGQSGREITMDEEIGNLLEEHKLTEQKHREELRALLEPYGISTKGSLKEIMEELEKRKAALVSDGKTVKEENEKLLDELQQITKAMIKSKHQCKVLFHRIIKLEMQIQKAQLADKQLKEKTLELAEQQIKGESVRKNLEEQTVTAKGAKEKLSVLQAKIEENRKKSNIFESKLEDCNDQTKKLEYAHTDNMAKMQSLRDDLAKELKKKKMIADNFIPRKVLKKLEERMRYDEGSDRYVIIPRTDTSFERPSVSRKLINPYLNLTRYTNLSKVNDIYYSNENLLAVEPEQAAPKSQDLVLEEEDPYVESIIAETMREITQELVIVCDPRKTLKKK